MIIHELLRTELENACKERFAQNIEKPLCRLVEEYLKGRISDRRLEEALINVLSEIRIK
jgi:hypothetical protein